jgi:uncharacterized protein YdeI (BOF family)
MTRTLIALAACVALIPAAVFAQDKGGETRDGRTSEGFWEEGPEVDVATSNRIVSMDEGHEIFMDRRSPEERDEVIWEENDID